MNGQKNIKESFELTDEEVKDVSGGGGDSDLYKGCPLENIILTMRSTVCPLCGGTQAYFRHTSWSFEGRGSWKAKCLCMNHVHAEGFCAVTLRQAATW
ncbi:MAG: hypothetical protein ACI4HI_07745 [Lachnospiraceae bacterium]